jgi:asparagine synthase (glutamine-hydrolysing)
VCAIAGVINYQDYNLNLLKDSLYHRGPDEQSIYYYKNIALVHNRLSIQDVLEGQQPFHFKGYTIVLNGEIYNHLELRSNYLKEFNFKTKSDTETLLYLYIKYRAEMFELIDGMYAFAILDKNSNHLILSRDRAGKKPLYLYQNREKIIFASELNGIKSIEKLSFDLDSLKSYMRCGFFFGSHTAFQNIEEIEAGSYVNINLNNYTSIKTKYFDILKYYKEPKITDLHTAKELVVDALNKSIESRVISSDLEVGAFLSGGIDSSLIVALASKYKSNLKTFTVKFQDGYDESHLAKLTAQKYGTKHNEIEISLNLRDDIKKILTNYGEPFFDSSAIPSYYVSQEAKKHLTVILNGDGADELFGGYRRYVGGSLVNIAKNFTFLQKYMPKPNDKKSLYSHMFRLLSMSSKKGLDFYLSSTVDILEDVYDIGKNSILDEFGQFLIDVNLLDVSDLSKMLYLDFSTILFSDLLVKMDIATMAHSLESRSPFLSKYILELAPRLSDELKINRLTTKYILREVAKDYLPLELIAQPKRGFEVPLKKWVDGELKEMVFDYLKSPLSLSRELISYSFIDSLLERRIDVSDEKRAKILWNLFCLEIWRESCEL